MKMITYFDMADECTYRVYSSLVTNYLVHLMVAVSSILNLVQMRLRLSQLLYSALVRPDSLHNF